MITSSISMDKNLKIQTYLLQKSSILDNPYGIHLEHTKEYSKECSPKEQLKKLQESLIYLIYYLF
ncbi:hypothetical protein EEL32_00070 (plasmid) [Brevibacillus laterosporus]|nr:hypothetical protein EEL32_00070 [Brevibacillus laterosporus]